MTFQELESLALMKLEAKDQNWTHLGGLRFSLIWYMCLPLTLTTWESYEACPRSALRKKWSIAAEMENKNRIFWKFPQHSRGHLDWDWSHTESRIWILRDSLRFWQWYLKGGCVMKDFKFLYKKGLEKISQVISNIRFNRAKYVKYFVLFSAIKSITEKMKLNKKFKLFIPLRKYWNMMIHSVFF